MIIGSNCFAKPVLNLLSLLHGSCICVKCVCAVGAVDEKLKWLWLNEFASVKWRI